MLSPLLSNTLFIDLTELQSYPTINEAPLINPIQILTTTATKEIRALGYTAPIFGVTGNSLPSDVAHFKLHGADNVLIKPLDIDDFRKAMQGEMVVLTPSYYISYHLN